LTTISELKKRRKQWIADTLSENFLKREFKIKPADIKKIRSETLYGLKRYKKTDVSWYLRIKCN